MTQNEIIRMAREAGFPVDEHGYNTKRIERFAALVAAHKAEIAIADAYRCGFEAGQLAEREKESVRG